MKLYAALKCVESMKVGLWEGVGGMRGGVPDPHPFAHLLALVMTSGRPHEA